MKNNKIVTYIFLLIIFGIAVGIQINYRESKKNRNKGNTTFSQETSSHKNIKVKILNKEKIDFAKKYPLEGIKKESVYNNFINKIYKRFYRIKLNFNHLDDMVKIHFPFRIPIITFNRKITGARKSFLSLDSLVCLKDEYFAFTINRKQNFEEEAKRVVEFSKDLNKAGIKFCSVTYPSKFSKFNPDFPPGIVDYSNYNVDTYLNVLKNNNVNILDLRENANKQFKEHISLFFKADHHWIPETAFWATSEILRYLNTNLNMSFDTSILNEDNFKFSTYPNRFLGSHGKKVTLALAKPDDITIIEPNFPTNYETSGLDKTEIKIGNYSDVVLDYSKLFYENLYEGDAYNTYSSPSCIVNTSPKAKYKVFIIADSFSIPVIPFLSTVTKEITHIDIRWENKYSVEKYILDLKPDLVILAYATDRFNWDRDPNHMENMFIFK